MGRKCIGPRMGLGYYKEDGRNLVNSVVWFLFMYLLNPMVIYNVNPY